jgi:glycogen debranching enzyme
MDHASEPIPLAASTARSPGGEEFDVVGRAGPVRLRGAPGVLAEARQDLLIIKEGAIFLCSRPNGDIHAGLISGEGLYFEDTRFLSEFRLTLGRKPLVLLSSSDDLAYAMVVDATNPNLTEGKVRTVPQQTLSIQRFRMILNRLHERISVRNYGRERMATELQMSFRADYADTLEVRGVTRRKARGQELAPKFTSDGLRFAYVGEDQVFRETLIGLHPPPTALTVSGEEAIASWDLALQRREKVSIEVTVEPSVSGRRRPPMSLESAEGMVFDSYDRWRSVGTAIRSDNKHFDGFVNASIRDLRALETPIEGQEIFAAGIPWYVAPFGRDSLLTCYESLMWNPRTAVDCLTVLAKLQARSDDPWRDAEPGKICHELRLGELAQAGLIPHTPYFGTVDATPLFLMLAASYYRWTADIDLMRALKPSFDAALEWITHWGDLDGDGFVEYSRRSSGGLRNQGWKDSEDCIVHANGALAEGPIALVEVQGYVYLAKSRIAEVYDALGDRSVASTLRREAAELKAAFHDAFWMPEEGTFALALDGRKRQVKSVTSNPGHCLYCGIVDGGRASAVADRLLAPDMFSGWGIRTLSKDSPAYNPMGYHIGSVWPHDNVLAAAGFKRYGLAGATERIGSALFEAATMAKDMRLDELYCGFDRRPGLRPVAYPVACRPQAWAAAVPLMLVQVFLGISAQAPSNVLNLFQPSLPPWLERLEVNQLRVGSSSLSLLFKRDGANTAFSLTAREGDVRVTTNR